VSQGIHTGNKARDFQLESLAGQRISLSDYRGHVVLVNFWATWCSPCRDEMPTLEAAYQAHKEERFVVLGVNAGDPPAAVAAFAGELGISFPILLDENSQVMKGYRVLGLPMSLLLTRDGIIEVRHVGYLTKAQLDSYLAELLTAP
jgi:peroxiredoxin